MTYAGQIEGQMTMPTGITITVTNSGGAATVVSFTAGTYFPSTLITHIQAQLIAQRPPASGTWTVALSTGTSGTGKVSIQCTDAVSWSIAWTSTTLRDLIGFTADITGVTTTQTGTKCARGMVILDSPVRPDGDPKRAPKVTDLRTTQSPTGVVLGLVGNAFYRHTNLRWSHVPLARVWEVEAAAAGNANGSWETFVNETQLGQASTWFTPSSLVKITDHQSVVYGQDLPVSGWYITGITSIEPKPADPSGWTGMWRIEIPQIVSSG